MNSVLNYKKNFRNWFESKMPINKIEEELNINNEISSKDKDILLREYKKFIGQIKLKKGMILSGLGSFFCFISCIFTMLNLFPELRGFILVGLTGIGVALILYGFYLIFE